MIPASFEYHRPDDIAAAISLLQAHGDDARVIAGGHSLIPMMKLRMTDLTHLVDLQGIDELRGIEVGPQTAVIGAMVIRVSVNLDHRFPRQPLRHQARKGRIICNLNERPRCGQR